MPKLNAYQIKVSLDSTDPAIWRRIVVLGKNTFQELHIAIQDAMGWRDSHLYEFEVINPLSNKKEFIGLPEPELSWNPDIVFDTKRTVSDIFNVKNKKGIYLYDFGDCWKHSLVLEKIFTINDKSKYPQCLAGERACPPEDCGGSSGYDKLLRFYSNDHDSQTEDNFETYFNIYKPDFFNKDEIRYRKIERNKFTFTLNDQKVWLRKLLQGELNSDELKQELGGKLQKNDIDKLYKVILEKPLRYRNRAISILASSKGIDHKTIVDYLFIPRSTIITNCKAYEKHGIKKIIKDERKSKKKYEDQEYIDKVFSIIHSPPSSYGFNRTTWKQDDILQVMSKEKLKISRLCLRKIIKNSGYHYRKAKTVLTSNDPKYREKIDKIKDILSNLGENEKFFSIDEYGPFAIKMQGGKSLVPSGITKTIPQWQKSKGSLIFTAALELSTNQMIHFYSESKDTSEMIKLLNVLIKKYSDQECIYLSWDAASWHASKKLQKRVDEINSKEFKEKTVSPIVKLVPLPTCAQFLNVIESVFSGMARAIIHNSNYASVEECKIAIDRYFADRNEHFKNHPQKAGNKIWGKERVTATFNESNNCKDPKYR